jgi:hypothetical protein
MLTVACGKFFSGVGGSLAVSFLASCFSGAGAMLAADDGAAGATGDEDGGFIPARGGVLGGVFGGLGREGPVPGGFGGPPAGADGGGMLGGLGGVGGVEGGLGRLPDGGGPLGGAAGFGGRFSMTVSRGFAAIGWLSFLGGRTMRTVSFFGSAMVVRWESVNCCQPPCCLSGRW